MSFYGPNNSGRGTGARADAHREALENDVAGRRLVKEAERAEAEAEGKPPPRTPLTRLLDAVRRRRD